MSQKCLPKEGNREQQRSAIESAERGEIVIAARISLWDTYRERR